MKKAINQWAFPRADDLSGGLRLAKEAGFEAVELTLNEQDHLSLHSTRAEAEGVRRELGSLSLGLASLATGVHWNTPFTDNNARVRREALQRAKKAIQVARWLETDALLMIPGAVEIPWVPAYAPVPYEVVYERSKKAILDLLPTAEKAGVTICVENVWNGFLLSPLEMRDYVDSFRSPFVGVYFDVANVFPTGLPEHWIPILGKRIRRVHFKDYRKAAHGLAGFVPLLSGDVNWPAVMGALEEIGYDGPVTAETSPTRHHPESVLFTTSTAMDFILGTQRRSNPC